MNKLFLAGTGKMGQMIAGLAKEQGIEVVGTADVNTVDALKSAVVQADAVIDFSHRDMLEPLAEFVKRNRLPLVCGTTGLEEHHRAILKELSCEAPVLYSANFSVGIAVLRRVAAQAAAALGEDFDIEIVETHHNQKVDAPQRHGKNFAGCRESQRGIHPCLWPSRHVRSPHEKGNWRTCAAWRYRGR